MSEKVRLVNGGRADATAEIPDERLIIEFQVDPDRWHRYLRTADFDPASGLREYISLGVRRGEAAVCATCVEPGELYTLGARLADELADDSARHSLLLRCRDCANLYDVLPEERRLPEQLTVATARRLYPGAL